MLRTAATLGAAAIACTSLASASQASASPSARAAASVISCRAAVPIAIGGQARVSRWSRDADTIPVGARDLAALPAGHARQYTAFRGAVAPLPATMVIPVYMHDIEGRHRGERKTIDPVRARGLVTILNDAMAGRQSPDSAPARFRFTLRKVDYHKRDGWYHAYFNGPRDRTMKRRLHRGDAGTLNVYLNGAGSRNEPLLGWSRFPWQYAANPALDGVSINVAALPGGRARGYNLGDTLVHETGHWLGLLHTFEGGCADPGDLVADTPAEADASYSCETTRDTCSTPGLDPVHNFMDYSLDACMNMFTPGQVARMDTAFAKWRN